MCWNNYFSVEPTILNEEIPALNAQLLDMSQKLEKRAVMKCAPIQPTVSQIYQFIHFKIMILLLMFINNVIYIPSALLLRGLDVLSTEESVLQGIQHAGSDLPIRSVRIGRDPLTNTSRGVCYIELNSVLDSMQLHNKLAHAPPTIDNKQVSHVEIFLLENICMLFFWGNTVRSCF